MPGYTKEKISCLPAHQGPGYLNSMQIIKFLIIISTIPHPEALSERKDLSQSVTFISGILM